jgi:hypothetical protein
MSPSLLRGRLLRFGCSDLARQRLQVMQASRGKPTLVPFAFIRHLHNSFCKLKTYDLPIERPTPVQIVLVPCAIVGQGENAPNVEVK